MKKMEISRSYNKMYGHMGMRGRLITINIFVKVVYKKSMQFEVLLIKLHKWTVNYNCTQFSNCTAQNNMLDKIQCIGNSIP